MPANDPSGEKSSNSIGDRSENTDIEQRLDALEKQNEELKAAIRQQRDGGVGVSRRQALAGLVGSGTLLGTVGSVSAQTDGDEEDDHSIRRHDHSGEHGTPSRLGEKAPVESITASDVNNVLYPQTANEIKTVLENASSGQTVVLPTDESTYSVDNPIEIRESITVVGGGRGSFYEDVNGTLQKENDAPLFDIRSCSPVFVGVRIVGIDGSTDGFYTDEEDRAGRIFMQECQARNCGRDGFRLESANVSRIDSCAAIRNGGDGLFLGGHNANAAHVVGFDAYGNSGNGVTIEGAYGTTVVGGYSAENSGHGYFLNSKELYVFGIGGEHNGGNTVRVGEDALRGFVLSTNPMAGRTFVNNGKDVTIWNDNPDLQLADGGVTSSYLNLASDVASGGWESYASPIGDYVASRTGEATDGNFVVDAAEADYANTGSGRGMIVTTPDGESHYRIRVDNSGELVTEEVDFRFSEGFPVTNQSLTVDGDVSELEGVEGLSVTDDLDVYARAGDVGGTVWFTWDESYFYLAADLEDNQHTHPDTGDAAIYYNDIVEYGVASPGADDYTRISTTMTPEGSEVIKGIWPSEWTVETDLDVPVAIERDEDANRTAYEVGVPWDELPIDPSTEIFELGLAIRDVDEDSDYNYGREGFRQWGSGILANWSDRNFKSVALVDQ